MIETVISYGSTIQNGGGLLLVLIWVVVKMSHIEKMVTRHNEILFPSREIVFKQEGERYGKK